MKRNQLLQIRKILTKADVILIIALILISLILFYSLRSNSPGKTVEIYHHNRLIRSTTLENDESIRISENILIEIKDGRIRIADNNCKNQTCVKQGWTDSFPIICVPNEIAVIIKDNDRMLITR